MAEKFPELDDAVIQDDFVSGDDTDFLRREAEMLGDEFKTEQDSAFLSDEKKDDSEAFEEQYPEVEENTIPSTTINEAQAVASARGSQYDAEQYEEEEDEEFGEPQISSVEPVIREKSEALKHWQERRELEIAERDQAEEKAKLELQEEATKHIDDFYDNYNMKKQKSIEETKGEAQKFLAELQNFVSQDNTIWNKALQLLNVEDADVVDGRDRSKFKEILQRIKNNTNAPGAFRN